MKHSTLSSLFMYILHYLQKQNIITTLIKQNKTNCWYLVTHQKCKSGIWLKYLYMAQFTIFETKPIINLEVFSQSFWVHWNLGLPNQKGQPIYLQIKRVLKCDFSILCREYHSVNHLKHKHWFQPYTETVTTRSDKPAFKPVTTSKIMLLKRPIAPITTMLNKKCQINQ